MSMQLRLAQVVKVIPKWRLCEVVYCDDGWRATDIPIWTQYMSTNTGAWSMHNLPRPPDELLAGGLQPNEEDRTVLAMVATIDGRTGIIGFLPHPMTQLAFVDEEQNRDIWRHPSGTIVTINKNGNVELHHTGGMFLRIASTRGGDPIRHEDLTPLCANENWIYPENDPPWITLSSGKFRLVIDPDGNTEFLSGGNLSVRYKGDADVDIGGDATVRVVGSAELDAGGDITARTPGNLTASAGGDATLQAVGDANVRAGGAARVQAAGNAELTAGGDVAVAALGDADVGAAGDATLASMGTTTVAGLEVVLSAPLVTVKGELVIEGIPFLGGLELVDEAEEIVEEAAEGAAAGANGAPPEVARADAQVAAAETSVEEAERIAIETSEPAIGTGPMDNEGGEGPGLSATGGEAQA